MGTALGRDHYHVSLGWGILSWRGRRGPGPARNRATLDVTIICGGLDRLAPPDRGERGLTAD